MKKEHILWTILNTIFLVAFNVFFFTLRGTENELSVWISYFFIHFAYLMILLTPHIVRKGKSQAVFGFSIYYVSTIYFIIEFLAGIIFILIASESPVVAMLVQLSFALLYSIILVSLLIANERTAEAEEKRKPQIDFIKTTSAKLKGLLDEIKDKETRKKVEQVYDLIYSSPVKTHPELEELETSIIEMVTDLEKKTFSDNKEGIITIANSLTAKINERNRLLKSLQ